MAFGKEIKRLREEAKISAEKLAEFIGIDPRRLRKWEQKDLSPKSEDIGQIERFFDLPSTEIMRLTTIRDHIDYYTVPEAAEKIIKARVAKGWSETEVIEKLVFSLKHLYVPSQYKKLETGLFLKTKSKIVKELDQILNISIHRDIYPDKAKEDDAVYALNDRISYVPVIAQPEYVTRFNDPQYIRKLRKLSLPEVSQNNERSRVFDVKGNNMKPLYEEGCHLICERVEQNQLLHVGDFYVYVIVLDTGIVVRRLKLKDPQRFVAKSDNKYYPQYFILVEDIKEMWLVKSRTSLEEALPEEFEAEI